MKNGVFYIIFAILFALVAFAGFSTSIVTERVTTGIGREIEERGVPRREGSSVGDSEEPKPVKVAYVSNPNIKRSPAKSDAPGDGTLEYYADGEGCDVPEVYTDYSGVAETEEVSLPKEIWAPDPNDVAVIAQAIYNEAVGLSDTERAAVAWCILNRVDDLRFPDTVREVVTSPCQFAFDWDTPILPELYRLADDVMCRHHAEKEGESDVGRVLPPEYCFFWGDGRHNYFRTSNTEQVYYDWSLESPYEE